MFLVQRNGIIRAHISSALRIPCMALLTVIICHPTHQSPSSRKDDVAEWLRRGTANPLGSARVSSNLIVIDFSFLLLQIPKRCAFFVFDKIFKQVDLENNKLWLLESTLMFSKTGEQTQRPHELYDLLPGVVYVPAITLYSSGDHCTFSF